MEVLWVLHYKAVSITGNLVISTAVYVEHSLLYCCIPQSIQKEERKKMGDVNLQLMDRDGSSFAQTDGKCGLPSSLLPTSGMEPRTSSLGHFIALSCTASAHAGSESVFHFVSFVAGGCKSWYLLSSAPVPSCSMASPSAVVLTDKDVCKKNIQKLIAAADYCAEWSPSLTRFYM